MTQPHSRKLKFITLYIDGSAFQCQLQDWKVENNTGDGERFYTFCNDGTVFDATAEANAEFYEEAEDEYTLALTFFADFRSGGISDFLWQNDQSTVTFQIDHHPDIAAEHVRLTGSIKIKAPSIGGSARTTEMTEVTLPIVGKPVYTRI